MAKRKNIVIIFTTNFIKTQKNSHVQILLSNFIRLA